jgi:hypothetical protein
MTTVEQTTEIAVALPGVEQKGHFGNVDFRVRNKVFASLPAPAVMTVRLDPEHARFLVESDPKIYVLHPGVWGSAVGSVSPSPASLRMTLPI